MTRMFYLQIHPINHFSNSSLHLSPPGCSFDIEKKQNTSCSLPSPCLWKSGVNFVYFTYVGFFQRKRWMVHVVIHSLVLHFSGFWGRWSIPSSGSLLDGKSEIERPGCSFLCLTFLESQKYYCTSLLRDSFNGKGEFIPEGSRPCLHLLKA